MYVSGVRKEVEKQIPTGIRDVPSIPIHQTGTQRKRKNSVGMIQLLEGVHEVTATTPIKINKIK